MLLLLLLLLRASSASSSGLISSSSLHTPLASTNILLLYYHTPGRSDWLSRFHGRSFGFCLYSPSSSSSGSRQTGSYIFLVAKTTSLSLVNIYSMCHRHRKQYIYATLYLFPVLKKKNLFK